MAAKPPHGDHVVVIGGYPSTTAAEPRHGQQASTGQAEEWPADELCCRVAFWFSAALLVVSVVGCVYVGVWLPEERPKYSVAVTAVAGLDPARDLSARGRPTLSPVLNVTVHIDNRRNGVREACIDDYGQVTAGVFYGDAFLGRGTVPQFCARLRRQGEGVARVSPGQDMVVPWSLRDELADKLAVGQASVAVQLMPWRMVCYATIGGGLSRC